MCARSSSPNKTIPIGKRGAPGARGALCEHFVRLTAFGGLRAGLEACIWVRIVVNLDFHSRVRPLENVETK